MKIFELLDNSYSRFTTAIKSYLSKTLSDFNTSYGNNTIFGQLVNVLTSAVQNINLYIEDAMVEQNKYTAQRKKSIYSLAQLSGYNPSLGKAAGAQIKLSFIPTTAQNLNVIIKNRESLTCTQNGLPYNIILPQEAIVVGVDRDNTSKYLYVVQGHFETQKFTSTGGQLYSKNISFSGDVDIDYLEVRVNDEKWERRESLYDMSPDAKEYVVRTSLNKGIDLIFGNEQYGRSLKEGDEVVATYLLHDGEIGNLNLNIETYFTFDNALTDISGDSIDGNSVFNVTLATLDSVTSGTNSEDKNLVREMIGCNSRALVLASPENYKMFINRFSFCGYNRTWSEKGSLVVNSLILRNYKQQLKDGNDYFNLKEEDFFLTSMPRDSILNCINNSGHQLAGVSYNIFDPELCKYAMYCYIKLKDSSYDHTYISNQIRKLVGEFFSNVENDIFIPKSDIIHKIKTEIDAIDSVDIYFLSERNENALKTNQYVEKTVTFNPTTRTYDRKEETIYLYKGENPGLGLDSHGNIYLANDEQFPVLMGGWSYISSDNEQDLTYIDDPLIIVFE